MTTPRVILCECGSCGSYHPADWDGDCRDDDNRYAGPEDYAERHGLTEEELSAIELCEPIEYDEAYERAAARDRADGFAKTGGKDWT